MYPYDNCPELAALHLANPHVRDLAWACFGPPLLRLETLAGGREISAAGLPLTITRGAWLQQLDRQPQRLLSWLEERPAPRLGLYFERLWQFFLTQDCATELLAHNLPVRVGGQTLGEFDCLYYCHRRKRPVHLELAVKFYLGHRRTTEGADRSDAAEWLGPNTVDRLDLKLQRLLQHQSRLSLHPAGRELLANRGMEQPLREIAVHGALFRPARDLLAPPAGYNAALPISYWYTLPAWRTLAAPEARFVIVPRLRWLSPLQHCTEAVPPAALSRQLEEHFARGGRPQLIALVDQQGCELQRFFLTGANWPLG
jgi:hypothetical protein